MLLTLAISARESARLLRDLVFTDGSSVFELHYCTRNEARTAFRELLMESRFAGGVHIHRDDGPADQRFDPAQVLRQAPGDAHLYVCGPGGFIQWVNRSRRARSTEGR